MTCSLLKGCTAYDAIPVFVAAGAISNAGEALRTEVHALQAVTIGIPIFETDCQVLKQAVAIVDHNYMSQI
jgi:hypothetical protein